MNRFLSLIPKILSYHSIYSNKTSKLLFPRRPQLALKRSIHICNKKCQTPKTPDLIYMPHLFRWMKSKLSFKYLKKRWDPEFSEGAFIYGTTRAICRITEIISKGKLEELDGLMTISARIKLTDDVTYRLSSEQKKLIGLKPEDIKILVPVSVTLTKEGNSKLARVNLRVLAVKWHEVANQNFKLVLVALQTEFLRNYNENVIQEWNISGFSILECAMLTEVTATRSDKY